MNKKVDNVLTYVRNGKLSDLIFLRAKEIVIEYKLDFFDSTSIWIYIPFAEVLDKQI